MTFVIIPPGLWETFGARSLFHVLVMLKVTFGPVPEVPEMCSTRRDSPPTKNLINGIQLVTRIMYSRRPRSIHLEHCFIGGLPFFSVIGDCMQSSKSVCRLGFAIFRLKSD